MFWIIQLILTAAFILFIPGYLLTIIIFKKIDMLERIALSVSLSLIFAILLGLILGYSNKMGLSSFNLWASYIISCSVLLIIYYKIK